MTLAATTRPRSLSSYLTSAWIGDDRYDGLDAVFSEIAEGAKYIQVKVRSATLADVIGTTGEINVQGEIVQLSDMAASDKFVEALSDCGRVAAVGSEEIEDTVFIGDGAKQNFFEQMDPLDGSSNIDLAVSIGSIFGIWRREGDEPFTDEWLFRPGAEQVAAAYVVYGSSTVLILSTEDSVQGFMLDPNSGEFILTPPDLKLPMKCSCYSANEGNFKKLDGPTQQALTDLRNEYSLRYVGSLVADFHRNLLKGGIFLYPGDLKAPNGKLRLMYKANPLGFIVEQAGGAASSGTRRILDIQPEELHQRTPLIIGNKDVVEKTVSTMSGGE
ncbi:MAG TPA: class 1 fructose-bisphosphatase [SAR202 cluster bacterium]|nr:class 1 fructose-bisphosphatase [SAR202 cluster bacterium]HJO82412.1 class 1 fructose-bisphosphatase [SAR202 cluster bacterium]